MIFLPPSKVGPEVSGGARKSRYGALKFASTCAARFAIRAHARARPRRRPNERRFRRMGRRGFRLFPREPKSYGTIDRSRIRRTISIMFRFQPIPTNVVYIAIGREFWNLAIRKKRGQNRIFWVRDKTVTQVWPM